MEIGASNIGNIVVLHPNGRIDGSTSAEFQTKLLEVVAEAADGVIIDFAKVDYISSAGLRALMTAIRQRKDRRLAVAMLQPVIQEIFTIARFQHVVAIFGSVNQAVEAWSTPPPAGAA